MKSTRPSARTNSRNGGTAGAPGSWPPPWSWSSAWRPGRLAPVRRLAARRGECRLFGGAGQDRPGQAAARAAFEKQAKSAPEPYRSLAALIAAQLREPVDAQVTALAAVAPTLSSAELADLALVIAAFKSVDSPARPRRWSPSSSRSPARPAVPASVRELQALAGGAQGRPQAGPRAVDGDRQGSAAPQGAQQRAQAMLNFYGPAEAK